jgi:hypothetical protein
MNRRGLPALAGEMLEARQPAALDIEEFSDDRVGFAERVVAVGHEHRGLAVLLLHAERRSSRQLTAAAASLPYPRRASCREGRYD